MLTVKTFAFNPFGVNTYLLYDASGECIIIDPGCMEKEEEAELDNFITQQNLRPVKLVNTHGHIDHIIGNSYIANHYKVGLDVHQGALQFLHSVNESAAMFGFGNVEMVEPSGFLQDGDVIHIGDSELQVLYTPGHAEGSLCFYAAKEKILISGDVLFCESIGRADLPTGNYKLLIESIKTKLFPLPGDTVVYPGHGPNTTIDHEKKENPFLNGD